jgi:hypothetical protein
MGHAMTWWCSRATAKSNERCIVAVAIRLHVNDRRRAPLSGYCVLSILVLSVYIDALGGAGAKKISLVKRAAVVKMW